MIGSIVRLGTGSPHGHVTVGFKGYVLNPAIPGDLLHPLDLYLWWQFGLQCVFWVPLKRAIRPFEDRPMRRHGFGAMLLGLLTWATRGRFRATTCVTMISEVLAEAGYAVPARVHTPRQLHGWLECQGFRHEGFAATVPCVPEGRARSAGTADSGVAVPPSR